VDGDAGFVKWQIGERWKSQICPRRVVTRESRALISLYNLYKAGFLLKAGGLLEQPAVYLFAMNAIDSYAAEARASDREG
jgi:hypothetical protein